jgi:hypothetical protein
MKESACSCQQCVRMCQHTPCLPLPGEVTKLVQEGYGTSLEIVERHLIKVIRPRRQQNGHCTFLRNGLCELHDKGLKPFEGRMVSCDTPKEDWSANKFVMHAWDKSSGKAVVHLFFESRK